MWGHSSLLLQALQRAWMRFIVIPGSAAWRMKGPRIPAAPHSWLLWPVLGSRTLFFLLSVSLGPLSGTQKPCTHPLSSHKVFCSRRILKCQLHPESFLPSASFSHPDPKLR